MRQAYGWASEPHRMGIHLVTEASRDDDGKVTCHDTAGLAGSWPMRDGGVFFEQEGGGAYCRKALAKASAHADAANGRR